MRRRDFALGGLALAALGSSEVAKPDRKVRLLQGTTIKQGIPEAFGPWQAQASELVGPEQAGRLARALYSETITRTYHEAASDRGVMLLAAYGDTQSDLLQLHRPESCYPAVGFTIVRSAPIEVPLGAGGLLPARQVVAELQGARENIIYWTRIGERLPQSPGEQRQARLRNAMEGFVSDGILVRCSMIGDSQACFPVLQRFVSTMLKAVPDAAARALVGTRLAEQLSRT